MPAQRIAGTAKIRGAAHLGAQITPPMGWNSWYDLYNNNGGSGGLSSFPNEAEIKANADGLVSGGYLALGYRLVTIDDGWNQRTSGTMVAIPSKFPDGAAYMATYIHANHELAGFYSSPNTNTCGGLNPGSLTFESADAASFASYGADWLKYDECPPPTTGQTEFTTMGTALASSGRKILFDINDADTAAPSWLVSAEGSSIRIGNDNGSTTVDAKSYGTNWASFSPYQSKGHWLDPDVLMGGLRENNSGGGNTGGNAVTDVEACTQFAHYTILAAPLIIGNAVANLDATVKGCYQNTELIGVDQDSLGTMGARISQVTCGSTFCEVWLRSIKDNCGALTTCYAIELVNRDTTGAHSISTTWSALGIAAGTYNIRDLIAHASAGTSSSGYTATSIPAFTAEIVKLTQ